LFVALLIPFSYEDKQALNNTQLMHPLTSGIHKSKHTYVQKADISNTWCKLAPCRKTNKWHPSWTFTI